MSNQPIDKGRVCFVAERYPSGQVDGQGQPVMKNRYATVGRATKWPADQHGPESIDIELDTMPIGHVGKLKLYTFWDSESRDNQQNNQQQNNQQGYQQNTGGYQQHGNEFDNNSYRP